MIEELQSESFCISSNDSGQFTESGEFESLDETTDCNQQKCGSSNSQKFDRNVMTMGVFLKNLVPVPVDPLIDPIFSSCFNCWQFGHRYLSCNLPKVHKFCVNCGRMHVKINSCPRCSRAYIQYAAIKKKKVQKEDEVNGHNVEMFEDNTIQFQNGETKNVNCNTSLLDTPIISVSDDKYLCIENNDYDDLIVDENEKSHQPISDLLHDFLTLLNGVKHWPIEVQNTILLHFAMERGNQRR